MKWSFTAACLLYFSTLTYGQVLEFSGKVLGTGLFYNGEHSPFWMHTNTRGRIDEETEFSGLVSVQVRNRINEDTFLEFGTGMLYHDGFSSRLQIDESYLRFQSHWWELILGRKQRREAYAGLSATNENILWSLNARPLPGFGFHTLRPVFFNGSSGLGIEGSWEEFFMDDQRYVLKTRLHHKMFNLVYRPSEALQLLAGLHHFVQWGGHHPEHGELPAAFIDYLRVISGREGEEGVDGQEINALGNHLGSYQLQLRTRLGEYKLELIYNHLFEDGSGRVLANTPDGRYGIFVKESRADGWMSALLYEFYYTRNQSANSPGTDGVDNYFNNNRYRSGWTYHSRIIGLPFFGLFQDRFRVKNNKIIVHHLGVSGTGFGRYPYKFLASYRKNYGSKISGNYRKHHMLSTYLEVELWSDLLDLNFQLGADFNAIAAPNFGAAVQLRRSLF